MTKEQEKELLKDYDSYEGFGAAGCLIAVICLMIVGVAVGLTYCIIPCF